MRRRLDHDGETELADWLDHNQPGKATRRLIAEAIDAYAGSPAQARFYMQEDPSNPGVFAIEPEPGLAVHVQEADPGEFTIARIIDKRSRNGD